MVFAAEDTGRMAVAIKVLPTDRASDPTILKAFMHEVRAAAKANHPSLAPSLISATGKARTSSSRSTWLARRSTRW